MSIKDLIKFFNRFFSFNSNYKSRNEVIIFKKFYLYFFYLFLIVIGLTIYILSVDKIMTVQENKQIKFQKYVQSNEFKNLGNFFLKNLKNPYKEIEYVIQNNDSIEAILNKYNIENKQIKFIVSELKKKN